MNISGIRPTMGFYDYNSIRSLQTDAPAAEPVEEVRPVEAEEVSAPSITQEEIDAARAKQTFGAYDFAKQYRASDVVDLKGNDSNIKSLDVTRAVDEMKRDSVLAQYQYFVGSKDKPAENASSRVFENFTL